MNASKLGLKAEQDVIRYLEKRSWIILKHRYRTIGSEIDIIAKKNKNLIFIEVKYRSPNFLTLNNIENLIPTQKKKSLQKGISHFLSQNDVVYEGLGCFLALVTKKSLKFYSGILEEKF
tara:strand:+ start:390 stop:746 length:357 start_codon:yes stop_codon:yes gene_type:complete